MPGDEPVRVLFVCLGNICRSPTADGVMRAVVAREGLGGRVEVDSAGTAAYHVGNPPDARSVAAAAQRGYDLSPLRARQATPQDFLDFDLVLAMDRANLEDLQALVPEQARCRPRLFLEFARSAAEDEVPDPYYSGPRGFEHVLDLVEEACEGLLAHLREDHL